MSESKQNFDEVYKECDRLNIELMGIVELVDAKGQLAVV